MLWISLSCIFQHNRDSIFYCNQKGKVYVSLFFQWVCKHQKTLMNKSASKRYFVICIQTLKSLNCLWKKINDMLKLFQRLVLGFFFLIFRFQKVLPNEICILGPKVIFFLLHQWTVWMQYFCSLKGIFSMAYFYLKIFQ